MLARVCSAAVNGIEAYPVEVEVNVGYGDTLVVIVGLPDAAVKDSRDRVSTALTNSGYKFPMGRTTINLAPADVKKEGPSFDLPIAVGMLAASEQIETDQLDHFVIVGELALTGAVRPSKGILPIAIRAKADGKTGILVPAENAAEAAVVEGLQVIPVQNLREAAQFLEGELKIAPVKVDFTNSLRIELVGKHEPHILRVFAKQRPVGITLDGENLVEGVAWGFDAAANKLIIKTRTYAGGTYQVSWR